jgi:hypothetical protein
VAERWERDGPDRGIGDAAQLVPGAGELLGAFKQPGAGRIRDSR